MPKKRVYRKWMSDSMNERDRDKHHCLTYLPLPHTGAAVAQTCVSLLENFAPTMTPRLVLLRAFTPGPPGLSLRQSVPHHRLLPYRLTQHARRPLLNWAFKQEMSLADPTRTIAYFWPAPPISLVKLAKQRGFLTVREMINTPMASAKVILDEAYQALGLRATHGITNEAAALEQAELLNYDYIFAPNFFVEESLRECGIDPNRILRSSYGWAPARYVGARSEPDKFRALFVGAICVRKGAPQLLEAWRMSGVQGELVLVGRIENCLTAMVAKHAARHNVRICDYTDDVGVFYRSTSAFVIPTLEEGGPQVTIEAAGCGLPVITTPMGSAGIIEDGTNGFIVPPRDRPHWRQRSKGSLRTTAYDANWASVPNLMLNALPMPRSDTSALKYLRSVFCTERTKSEIMIFPGLSFGRLLLHD